MNIVNGFDIDTPEGAKAYLESEGFDIEECVLAGRGVIARVKALCLAPVVVTEGKCDCAVCGEEFTPEKKYHNVCDWCAENTC